MLEMERLLCAWIENCNNRNTPISLAEVLFKAQSLFKFAKTKFDDLTEAEINQPFVASPGWWDRYSKRMNLASENLLGEAASADIKAAEEYPEKLKKIIDGKILYKKRLYNKIPLWSLLRILASSSRGSFLRNFFLTSYGDIIWRNLRSWPFDFL